MKTNITTILIITFLVINAFFNANAFVIYQEISVEEYNSRATPSVWDASVDWIEGDGGFSGSFSHSSSSGASYGISNVDIGLIGPSVPFSISVDPIYNLSVSVGAFETPEIEESPITSPFNCLWISSYIGFAVPYQEPIGTVDAHRVNDEALPNLTLQFLPGKLQREVLFITKSFSLINLNLLKFFLWKELQLMIARFSKKAILVDCLYMMLPQLMNLS